MLSWMSCGAAIESEPSDKWEVFIRYSRAFLFRCSGNQIGWRSACIRCRKAAIEAECQDFPPCLAEILSLVVSMPSLSLEVVMEKSKTVIDLVETLCMSDYHCIPGPDSLALSGNLPDLLVQPLGTECQPKLDRCHHHSSGSGRE